MKEHGYKFSIEAKMNVQAHMLRIFCSFNPCKHASEPVIVLTRDAKHALVPFLCTAVVECEQRFHHRCLVSQFVQLNVGINVPF